MPNKKYIYSRDARERVVSGYRSSPHEQGSPFDSSRSSPHGTVTQRSRSTRSAILAAASAACDNAVKCQPSRLILASSAAGSRRRSWGIDGGGGSARRGSSAARVAAARTQTAHMRVESSGATDSHGPPGTRSATRHVGVSSASSARGGSAMRAVGAAGHAREGLRTEITAEIAAVVDRVS